MHRFITPLELFEFGIERTAVYDKIRAELERKGKPIGPLDTLIASLAVSLGLILVINNEREFQRIPEIKLENWVR